MLENLKDSELQIASKLIFDGLSMAKASMEQILKSPVVIKRIDYGNAVEKFPNLESKPCDRVHVIKTALIGQLKGTSHLIFSDKEVQSICEACLPKEILESDSQESTTMKIAFLTEIDNMLAAAVITEFSNFLGLDIYGHVPHLYIMKEDEIKDYLEKETSELDSVIHFKAIFQGTEVDIAPDFVWIFQNDLMHHIRQAV